MLVTLLKAKLHKARVTGADLNYEGSITIDADLLGEVGMRPYEKVLVVNIENGARFETYIIRGEPGSGVIQVNGAAARLVQKGDRVIVMAFAHVEEPPEDWQPTIVRLDDENGIVEAG